MNNQIINDPNNFTYLKFTELINLKKQINELMNNYKLIINNYDTILNNINKNIYEKCVHNWIIDHNVQNEHTEYICSLCNLSK
jgi:hypothetical protein